MADHAVVTREEWVTARKELLEEEKRLTRLRDELSRRRRALPWVKVETTYVFDGPDGRETLADLFAGRSQLIIHHFMFGPDWQEGCIGCSFHSDHADGALVHLENHDVSFVRVSRAPLAMIEAFKRRMGWRAKWVSSYETNFNYDYHVSFTKDELAKGAVHYNYGMIEGAIEDLSGLSACLPRTRPATSSTPTRAMRGVMKGCSARISISISPQRVATRRVPATT
jgi:predicted dithiol-disulfide oxidoreductase (DUF899 family)